MFDQDITIESLIKVAEEQAKAEETPKKEMDSSKKDTEDKSKETMSKDDAEKCACFLESLADFFEKRADELPLDLAPVPGTQTPTQDTPLAQHDITGAAGGNVDGTQVHNDEREPVKETQGHLGNPQPPLEPVSPDAPGVQKAPAKQEGSSKVANYLRFLQTKLAQGEGVPAGQLGYDSNPAAANDRSEQLLTEPGQVGMTQPSESSGLVDKNQQAVDDTPAKLVVDQKKDMAQLLEEPMQSKKHDKVLADALPMMEPKAEPKVAAKELTNAQRKALEKYKSTPFAARHPMLTTAGTAALGAGLGGAAGGITAGPGGAAIGSALGGLAGIPAGAVYSDIAAKKALKKAYMGKSAQDDEAVANFLRARQHVAKGE